MAIKIRRSTPPDGPRAVEIWRDSVNATHDFLKPEDRIEIDKLVRDFLPGAPLWLAVDDNDRPVGFMLLSDANMDALFIDPASRGSGIGRALVEHALSIHPELTTEVNEQNHQAVEFYEHLGFTRTGRSDFDQQGRPYPLIYLRKSRAT